MEEKNLCCKKFKNDQILKNIMNAEILCKNCGSIINHFPFNDGNEFYRFGSVIKKKTG